MPFFHVLSDDYKIWYAWIGQLGFQFPQKLWKTDHGGRRTKPTKLKNPEILKMETIWRWRNTSSKICLPFFRIMTKVRTKSENVSGYFTLSNPPFGVSDFENRGVRQFSYQKSPNFEPFTFDNSQNTLFISRLRRILSL